MSVMVETSAGSLVFDLYTDTAPKACLNFVKLCKMKYYNGCLFFNVMANYLVQTGDPTGTGRGGSSVYGLMYGDQARFFEDEIVPSRRFDRSGLLCMANSGPNTNASSFFVTTRGEDLEHIEEKHTIFGELAEGEDVLQVINEAYVDERHRPYRDIRILHTYVLDDPFDDPERFEPPDGSPRRFKPEEERVEERLAYDEKVEDGADGRTQEQVEEDLKDKEAASRAQVLEIVGDLPHAEVKPPENVLFVCKLNAVTEDDDLEIIFSRFGEIKSCEVIRDQRTGESLNYAFVEFATEEQCTEAYFKMNNVLIDDRRIKVDFSQSVSKLWNKWALGKGKARAGARSRDGGNGVSSGSQRGQYNRGASSRFLHTSESKPPAPREAGHRAKRREFDRRPDDFARGKRRSDDRDDMERGRFETSRHGDRRKSKKKKHRRS